MLEGGAKRTRGNLALWIAVTVISMIGLGANVYKANSGEPIDWASMIAEAVCLVVAALFVVDYFKKRKEQKEEEK
ncbi:MAG: hypothetical protein IKU88_09155 [Alistipes sp.]|nr:hypothetical protein [Alistipes sp.]